MTEPEWLTCGSRLFMRRMLRNWRFSPLHWVNFNLACIRRVWSLIDDDRCYRLVDLLESCCQPADVYSLQTSRLVPREVQAHDAIRELWRRRADPLKRARVAAARAIFQAKWQTLATSEMVAVAVGRWRYGAREERRAHCDLIRDIFGNPFRPVTFAPEWRTSTAVVIARGMYESRDFSAMPILADALQDAGCDSDDVLNHSREEKAVHVRGCWVVDLVLGKE